MAKMINMKFNEEYKSKALLSRKPSDYKNEWTLKNIDRDIDRLEDYIAWLEIVRCTEDDNRELTEAKRLLKQFKLARLDKMTKNLLLVGLSLWLGGAIVCLLMS